MAEGYESAGHVQVRSPPGTQALRADRRHDGQNIAPTEGAGSIMTQTPEIIRMLAETHDMVSQLKSVVVGMNGDDGLAGDLRRLHEQHDDLEIRHNRLEAKVSRVIGILAGSGILAGGLWGMMR